MFEMLTNQKSQKDTKKELNRQSDRMIHKDATPLHNSIIPSVQLKMNTRIIQFDKPMVTKEMAGMQTGLKLNPIESHAFLGTSMKKGHAGEFTTEAVGIHAYHTKSKAPTTELPDDVLLLGFVGDPKAPHIIVWQKLVLSNKGNIMAGALKVSSMLPAGMSMEVAGGIMNRRNSEKTTSSGGIKEIDGIPMGKSGDTVYPVVEGLIPPKGFDNPMWVWENACTKINAPFEPGKQVPVSPQEIKELQQRSSKQLRGML